MDWIIVSLKSPALTSPSSKNTDEHGYNLQIKDMISKLVNNNTRILILMNGMNCEEPFVKWFEGLSIFGGMCFVCANRIRPQFQESPLIIRHIAHGALHIGHVNNNTAELNVAKDLWRTTSLESEVTVAGSLLAARWSKLFWNLPFNGLAVSMGGIDTELIATTPELRMYADKILSDASSSSRARRS